MKSYEELKRHHRLAREKFDEDFSIRLHRSLSWLERSEQEVDDPDAAFIFLWISFNANYSLILHASSNSSEQNQFADYFRIVVACDYEDQIYDLVWRRFSNEIKSILDNKYIYSAFWRSFEGSDRENWKKGFSKSRRLVSQALRKKDTLSILNFLFSRLYTLRNQLIHGNATWNGKVNRQQVIDGHRLLAALQPLFLEIMIRNPDENWGCIAFPVIEQN